MINVIFIFRVLNCFIVIFRFSCLIKTGRKQNIDAKIQTFFFVIFLFNYFCCWFNFVFQHYCIKRSCICIKEFINDLNELECQTEIIRVTEWCKQKNFIEYNFFLINFEQRRGQYIKRIRAGLKVGWLHPTSSKPRSV